MSTTPLRNGEAECIFCGERAMTPDVPCSCEEATRVRNLEKSAAERAERARAKITKLFRDSEGYREEIDDAGLEALLYVADKMADGVIRKATVYVGWYNKATLKHSKKGISVKRTETLEEEAKDEDEEE